MGLPWNGRFEDLRMTSGWHAECLKNFLYTPPEERDWAEKPDGSLITHDEYEMGLRFLRWLKTYPAYKNDSAHHEETSKIRRDALWHWFIDPFDPTKQTVNRDRKLTAALRDDPRYAGIDPEMFGWKLSTSMLSLGYRENARVRPAAFGLAVPLLDEVYTGNIEAGMFRNDVPYDPPEPETDLVLGLNHEKHAERFMRRYDFPIRLHFLAGPATFFIIQGEAVGGVMSAKRPYETMCAVAAVLSLGAANPKLKARVTDEYGADYHAYTEAKRVVWTLPQCERKHDDIVEEALTILRREEWRAKLPPD